MSLDWGLPEFFKSPRARLGKFAAQHKNHSLFDIGIVFIPPRHDKLNLSLAAMGGLAPVITPSEAFQKYKAILDIDGNSWSSRFGLLLCYNSVILKVDPEYVDYFHFKYLKPWIHYVPVNGDLSDLTKQARYVLDRNHSAVVQTIISNANAWCRQHMVHDAVAKDLLDIWEAYVGLLDIGNPLWQEVWARAKHRIFSNQHFVMAPLSTPYLS